MHARLIHPVILSGGAGSRLWPASKACFPKQFIRLTQDLSPLQHSLIRFRGLESFARPVVVGADRHGHLITEQAEQQGLELAEVLLEPVACDTALSVAAAAIRLSARDPSALMLVMPADHLIDKPSVLAGAVETAADIAAEGWLVTFGIRPTAPETGYGYIERSNDELGPGAWRAESFTEKPSGELAKAFLSGGRHEWNSGIFLFRADVLLEEMHLHASDVFEAAAAASNACDVQGLVVRLDKGPLEGLRPVSFDKALMERSKRVAVVPIDGLGWTDIGSWRALHAVLPKDAVGNAVSGEAVLASARDTLAYLADGRLLVGLGISDLVVVSTPTAMLVMHKDWVDELKSLVGSLPAGNDERVVKQERVRRPWGHYECLHRGDRHQVKHIYVKPGGQLSLQRHFHRAEHWVVVKGTGRVTQGNEVLDISENEAVYLPLGIMHRLENPGRIPLSLIEVQLGSYLGEDDIERFQDRYGRD
jgi:mannose-1-phosphate guanylyltransferase / mannose-6-phosphate isomerase